MLKYFTNKKTSKSVIFSEEPNIYTRVKKEVTLDKMMAQCKIITNVSLIRKYFKKLRFYYNYIMLRKRKILSSKLKFLAKLKLACYLEKRIDLYALNNFNQLRRIKTFCNFIKITSITRNLRIIKVSQIFDDKRCFLKLLKNKHHKDYDLVIKSSRLAFKLFFVKILKEVNKNFNLRHKIKEFLSFRSKNARIKTIGKIISNYNENMKTFVLVSVFYRSVFLERIKKIKTQRWNTGELIKFHRISTNLKYFINKVNTETKNRKKNEIVNEYYPTRIKSSFFEALTKSFRLTTDLRNLLATYVLADRKRKLVDLWRMYDKNKRDVERIKNDYKLYRYKRFKDALAQFYILARQGALYRLKKNIAFNVKFESRRKKAFNLICRHHKKMKFLKILLKRFHQVHNNTLKLNYLNILSYKASKGNDKLGDIPNKLSHIIKWRLKLKFEKRLILWEMKKMRTFFEKAKALINFRNIQHRKKEISVYFHSKKLLIKSYITFHRLRIAKQIKRSYIIHSLKAITTKIATYSQKIKTTLKIKSSFEDHIVKRHFMM